MLVLYNTVKLLAKLCGKCIAVWLSSFKIVLSGFPLPMFSTQKYDSGVLAALHDFSRGNSIMALWLLLAALSSLFLLDGFFLIDIMHKMNLKMTKLKTNLVLRQRCEYSVCLSLGILVLGEERCAVEWTLDFSSSVRCQQENSLGLPSEMCQVKQGR